MGKARVLGRPGCGTVAPARRKRLATTFLAMFPACLAVGTVALLSGSDPSLATLSLLAALLCLAATCVSWPTTGNADDGPELLALMRARFWVGADGGETLEGAVDDLMAFLFIALLSATLFLGILAGFSLMIGAVARALLFGSRGFLCLCLLAILLARTRRPAASGRRLRRTRKPAILGRTGPSGHGTRLRREDMEQTPHGNRFAMRVVLEDNLTPDEAEGRDDYYRD